VAADYIRSIYEHALERIATKVPEKYLENDVQKKFVISVPAVWSDKAKDTTLKAAKLAGIYPATLIKEPEAAAMYTLHVLQDRGLEVGDALVICDAGGGTVDLISYEILQTKPSLQLKELVPSKGGMAGSLQLNKRFEEQIKMLVGEDQYYHLRKTAAYDQAVKFFDRTVKPEFRGNKDVSWYVNFPMADLEDDESQGLKRDSWELKSDVVERIFSPLIEDIGRMVDDQVNLVQKKRLAESHLKGAEVKAIVLVGGFGASEYLKQSIQLRHPDIQVIQPHDAWAAIVK
jgi:molecular chaperone DnaK (HSP70)